MATACAGRNAFAQCIDAGRHQASQATPPKLSQNPAASSDNGSNTRTASIASASTSTRRTWRRARRASTTTAIISTVRTVGNANPAAAA